MFAHVGQSHRKIRGRTLTQRQVLVVAGALTAVAALGVATDAMLRQDLRPPSGCWLLERDEGPTVIVRLPG